MGTMRFKNYIAEFASAMMHVEDAEHPVMENVPAAFEIKNEEWYGER